jgi:hypothetical protein
VLNPFNLLKLYLIITKKLHCNSSFGPIRRCIGAGVRVPSLLLLDELLALLPISDLYACYVVQVRLAISLILLKLSIVL